MGKFKINVVGNTFSGGVLSYEYNVDNNSQEIIDACIELFKEFWEHYEPYSIEAKAVDIDELQRTFRPKDNEMVKQKIEKINQEKIRQEKEERELFAKLKAKYEGK